MDKVMDELEDEASKHEVQINEGSGPQYEDFMEKMIH